ncbi:MAG TPA: LEPR-XLL domain-containing protein, partial [Planctomycetota bacterium]|nr:LEPR-XLL domain-containing protein [Planctomycetota bacterium]
MARSSRPAASRLSRFVVEALEPRLLYSADLGPSLLGAVVSPVAEQRLLESEQPAQPEAPTAQTQAREVVFVDASTPDAERLIADLEAQPGRAIDV